MPVSITLANLAAQIGANLEGVAKGNVLITGIASLTEANKQEISFFSNNLYRQNLTKTQAAAVILSSKDQDLCQVSQLVMENPYLGYAKAARFFCPPPSRISGIHPTAWVSEQAIFDRNTVSIGSQAVINAKVKLGKNIFIGAGCVLESEVEIDDDSQLMANVTLCAGTYLGKRVIVHPGAVIGSDGFGNANDAGKWIKVPQLGGVIIGDDVEIGANTTIDKGALENTIIGNGARLDNQIQIGHNVEIGEHTALAGCVGIAGSTRIGRYCKIGGGVGIAGHLELVDYVCVTGGSIVLQSIRKPGVYSSGTALELNQNWHRNYHRFKQLDTMAKRLNKLEKNI
ncbi:MAG: UDP-3-O-(3-hydroxymyristoyl)glucosamine N-acyltransferase [Thiomargarita sp.]|nr:UDP-3-O-(3-hydroxymyristoyl)glucosamine N-acyltransferase [Thiomargarita sp.]